MIIRKSKKIKKQKKIKVSKVKTPKITKRQKELNKLFETAKLYKSKNKKYPWIVLFGKYHTKVHGKIAGFFMKDDMSKKNPTVWNGINESIQNKKEKGIKDLSEDHINILLKEMKHVK